MLKIKVKISETKYLSFYKSLILTLHLAPSQIQQTSLLIGLHLFFTIWRKLVVQVQEQKIMTYNDTNDGNKFNTDTVSGNPP